jgi:hypothetical protein
MLKKILIEKTAKSENLDKLQNQLDAVNNAEALNAYRFMNISKLDIDC